MKNSKRTLILLLLGVGSVMALTGLSKQLIKHPVKPPPPSVLPEPDIILFDAFKYFKKNEYLNVRSNGVSQDLDATFVLPILRKLQDEYQAEVSIAVLKNDTTRVYSIFIHGVKESQTDRFVKTLGNAVADYDGDVLWRRAGKSRIQLDFLTPDEAKALYRQ